MGLIHKYIMSLFWFQRDGHKPFRGQSRQINAGNKVMPKLLATAGHTNSDEDALSVCWPWFIPGA